MSDTPEPETPETVKVARDLREIERLSTSLREHAGTRAAHREMPGGNSMAMMAPVANHEAYENQIEAAEMRGDYLDLEHEDDTWEPPLQTLTFWSEDWRREHGAESDLTPTIGSEAAFLRDRIDWAWDEEPRWDDFRRDVRNARLRLEDELIAGTRTERTRTPCMNDDCGGWRIIKVWQSRVAWDFYKCTRCKRRYDHSEYVRAQQQALAMLGTEKFVRIQDAVGALRSERGERTIRRWFERCEVASYCDLATHQVYVWWPDIRRLHVETPTRNRRRSA